MGAEHGEAPGDAVLAGFGLAGALTAQPGGRGTAWRCGPTLLKPLDMDPSLLSWQAQVLSRLDRRSDFRVSPPLPAVDGSWVVSGWTAWRFGVGHHEPGHWPEIVEVGRRFHRALAAEPRPASLAHRRDAWSIGDRVAWAELDPGPFRGSRLVVRLLDALRPVRGSNQLVHGDLTGNVLFDDALPPLVIDFSPYWRPPEFASAVVVADALLFEGAGPGVDVLGPDRDAAQYLIRALIYRMVTDLVHGSGQFRSDAHDRYASAVDLALAIER